jgi:hypothetical protein
MRLLFQQKAKQFVATDTIHFHQILSIAIKGDSNQGQ